MLLQQLKAVRCADPYSYLGLHQHPEGKGLILRAWLPGAVSVSARDLKTGKSVGKLKAVAEGESLFELSLPRRKNWFNYRLDITTEQGEYQLVDPYQFGEAAAAGFEHELPYPRDVYLQLGAQLRRVELSAKKSVEGVRFSVYAPNASAVSVLGEFNWWNGACHPMQKLNGGYWAIFVPGLSEGCQYKFELKDAHGDLLPHKQDPVGFYAEQFPSFASVVYDHSSYQWQDSQWQQDQAGKDKYATPMSVYEVHVGSWRRKQGEDGQLRSLTWRELAVELVDYASDMGYTHIELMPVSEHPFDGSWGYQPIGLFAPTSRFGNPDDFKYFVDQCHQRGLGVIIDWVPAHFPSDSHGLAQFDGTPLYEYADPRRGWHQDWSSYIYDYGRDHVRRFLVANAMYWLEHFHIDGLRVDAVASMLYLDYSREEGEWIPNVDGGRENYEAISLLRWMNEEVYRHFPHAMTIAEESTSFPKVSRPTSEGGLGFGFKWNMGWMHDSLEYMQRDPIHRGYHHGELTFSMIYAYDENFVLPLSHDEVVYGKKSVLYKMPGDEWQQAANLRAYTAFMFSHPGKKLNFMGNEIAQGDEWDHDGSVQWHLQEYSRHQGQQQLTRDLNRLYTTEGALHRFDCSPEGFCWLDHSDAENSLFSFVRFGGEADAPVVVICNMTPQTHRDYRLGVPEGGEYEVILNTDSEYYGGSNFDVALHAHSEPTPWQGQEHSVVLNLPPLASVWLKRKS